MLIPMRDIKQEHVEAGLGGRPEVGVRGLLQLADEEPQAHLTVDTQEAARLAFTPAQEFRLSMLTFRYTHLLNMFWVVLGLLIGILSACWSSCNMSLHRGLHIWELQHELA